MLVTAFHSDWAPLRWWRSRGELFRDITGAAAFTIVAFLPFLADSGVALGELPHRQGGALALVLALAQVLPLAVRRRWPAVCFAVVSTGFAVYQCLGYPNSFTSVGFILALYASGAYQRTARTASRVPRRVRRLARLAVAAQVVFVASWLLAAAWQGPRYSVFAHSISDMYAVTAPGAAFLIVMFTLCGAATMWFTWRSLRTALRPAGRLAGRLATLGAALLALSIFGLGDLLTVSERLIALTGAAGIVVLARGVIRRSGSASH